MVVLVVHASRHGSTSEVAARVDALVTEANARS